MTAGRRVGAACGLVVALIALGGCSGGPAPEQEVRDWIERAREAGVAGDVGDLARMISDDYRDASGRDKRTLVAVLRLELRLGTRRHARYRVDGLVVDGAVARVDLLIAVAARPLAAEGWLDGLEGDLVRLTAELRRESGDWRLMAADWRPASGSDLLGG